MEASFQEAAKQRQTVVTDAHKFQTLEYLESAIRNSTTHERSSFSSTNASTSRDYTCATKKTSRKLNLEEVLEHAR